MDLTRITLIFRVGTAPGSVQAERLIAVARVLLAAFAMVRLHLVGDATLPTPGLLATASLAYLAYAVVLAGVLWRAPQVRRPVAIATHTVDLGVFGLVFAQPAALSGLFLLCFTFAVVAGLMRWQWAGAVWTAVGGFGVFALAAAHAELEGAGSGLGSEQWFGRALAIGATGCFLAILAAWERRVRAELAQLSGWSRMAQPDLRTVLTDNLGRGAAMLQARRLVLLFEDPDEPFLTVAEWDGGVVRSSSEAPGTFHPLVAEDLDTADFLCYAAGRPVPRVLVRSDAGLRGWRGSPLHPELTNALGLRDVVAVAVRGDVVTGRLLAALGRSMTADDLERARSVANEIAASLDRFCQGRRAQEHAASEERGRLSRELHDGVLQSLSASALRLKTVELALGADATRAAAPLQEAQQLLSDGQRELRFWVEEQKPSFHAAQEHDVDLSERLRGLAQHVEQVWGLRVTVEAAPLQPVPADRVVHGLYRIAQEALVNSARHGHATAATLTLSAEPSLVRLVLKDDGRGFRFQGRLEHDELARQRLGPVVLKARVAELGGRLAIESAEEGARLEIEIPLAGPGG